MHSPLSLALLQDSDCPEVKGFGSSCSYYAFVEFENEDVAKMVVEIMSTINLVKDFICVVLYQQKKYM